MNKHHNKSLIDKTANNSNSNNNSESNNKGESNNSKSNNSKNNYDIADSGNAGYISETSRIDDIESSCYKRESSKLSNKPGLLVIAFVIIGVAITLMEFNLIFNNNDKSLDVSDSFISLPISLDSGSNNTSVTPAVIINDPYPTPVLTIDAIDKNGISIYSRTYEGYFYTSSSASEWNLNFLKGVNMGLTLPTTNLNNPDIPYETYFRWFGMIKSMHANTVKIFTIMNPEFYNAFYDYNQQNKSDPLYLLQGIWINENDMVTINDAYGKNNKILNSFKRTAKEMLDIVHGNSSQTSYGSIMRAVYDKDVSPYIAGFILGLEWSPEFIIQTNKNNPSKNSYSGTYLMTTNASPFETFLCNVGDYLVKYQTSQYNTQTPLAFLNWSTTDPIRHTNEPFPEEDAICLDTNHIIATPQYLPGLFAAIDIYPYYPEFINYQREYITYKDPSGILNPYRAYLEDLKRHYKVPVVVAEFGVPTSRGIAHKSVMGYNQGGITEKQQGEINLAMMQDIAKENYAGAMMFSWQDEWFKQTWNVIKYSATNTFKRTPDRLSAEQHYGLLSFDIASAQLPFYPDGDIKEWASIPPAISDNTLIMKISMQEDALSLMIQWDKTRFNPSSQSLAIAFGTTNRGSDNALIDSYGLNLIPANKSNLITNSFSQNIPLLFSKPVDFILLLNGKSNTRLLVDSYYDSFYYRYMIQNQVFPIVDTIMEPNTGIFNPIRQFISNEIILPVDKKTIDPAFYESGILKFGQANPAVKDYDSLSDFYYTDNFVEIKLPWTLLGVMNFIEKKRIADFYSKNQITFEDFDALTIGFEVQSLNEQTQTQIQMINIPLAEFEEIIYKERLKSSYEILQKGLSSIMLN